MKSASNTSKSKEIADYFECVKFAYHSFDFEYLLVVEDDAEPAHTNAIHDIVYRLLPHINGKEYDLIKLYYNPDYQGFSEDVQRVLDLISMSSLVAVVIIHLVLLSCKKDWNLFICFPIWFIVVVFLLLLVGRQHSILALRNSILSFRLVRPAHDG